MPVELGDTYQPTVDVRDGDGNPTSDVTVTVVLTLPDGSSTNLAAGATSTTGRFVSVWTTTLPGRHTWVATADGPGIGGVPQIYSDTFEVVATATGIVSVEEAQAHLGDERPAAQEQLRGFILTASEMCEEYTKQRWRRTPVTAALDGGRRWVQLLDVPVLSMTSVTVDGTATTDYLLDGTLLYAGATGAGVWPAGHGNVVATYLAGPPGGIVPATIRQGVLELVRHLWRTQRGASGMPRGADPDGTMGTAFSLPRRVEELWAPRTRLLVG